MAKKKIAKKTPGFDFGANVEAPAAPAPAVTTRRMGNVTLTIRRLIDAGKANKEIAAELRAMEKADSLGEEITPDDVKLSQRVANVRSQYKAGGSAPRKSGAGVVKKVARKAAVAKTGGEVGNGVRVGSYGDVISAGKLLAGLGRDEAIKIIDALLE